MSRKWTAALFVLLTVAVAGCQRAPEPTVAGFGAQPQTPDAQQRVVSPEVRVDTPGQYSWSLRETKTGAVRGSANQDRFANTVESMVKAWIAFDFLNGLGQAKPSPADLTNLHRMIHVSDDQAAQRLYRQRGSDQVILRLIRTCGLTGTTIKTGWWSKTRMTADDATRMGQCLFDGRHLSPQWTKWLREEMRNVDPSNAFGIAQAPGLAGKPLAIKNGWTEHGATGNWAVNCLAVWEDKVLAVLASYPAKLGQSHGASVCRQVAEQLFPA
ncbi:serine hydrolase [Crossiella sp. SN42]|uniref:serine hydrolase n=1 Tax=Crossiella sp. SN42 TaxID=2944808 RepID=UPI00207D4C61|nr:serine hydrolase [Crossiella sp. SN42]MCO1575972.1 serine hydrolase [Crossiella sp. SN42]